MLWYLALVVMLDASSSQVFGQSIAGKEKEEKENNHRARKRKKRRNEEQFITQMLIHLL